VARYYIKTFGCKVNQVESDELHAALALIDACNVDSLEEAEFVIVNTCTVTGEADRKVRKELRKAARTENVLAVIVTGCSAALKKEELREIDEKVFVLAARDEIPAFIARMTEEWVFADEVDAERPEHPASTSSAALAKRVRVPVKVQDGCESFCSYCIVPFVRGACLSVPADEVVGRVHELANLGVKEVVLTGINLGNYADGECSNLAALLGRLQAETDIYRVRLSSIEPGDVAGELLSFLRPSADGSMPLLCEHLHIPLQSGSDYVLGEMNRRYTVDDFREIVRAIRQVNPHTAITTDVIVGYPCEDDEDFQQTLDLVQKIGFANVHVFRYSPREGTAAASLMPLDPQLIKQRAQRLQELADQQAADFKQQLTGKKLEVIIETVDDALGVANGTSREYLRPSLPVDSLPKNVQAGDIVTLSL